MIPPLLTVQMSTLVPSSRVPKCSLLTLLLPAGLCLASAVCRAGAALPAAQAFVPPIAGATAPSAAPAINVRLSTCGSFDR